MTLTLGSAVTVKSSGFEPAEVGLFDASNGVAFYDDGSVTRARYLSVSGVNVSTPVAEITVDAAIRARSLSQFIRISSTAGLLVYGNTTTSKAVIISLSGTTLSVGTAVTLTEHTEEGTVKAFLSTHVLFIYRRDSDNVVRSRILSVAGTTITEQAAISLSPAAGYALDCAILSSTGAMISYQDNNNSDYPTASILTRSGNTLTQGAETVVRSSAGSGSGGLTGRFECAMSEISSTEVVHVYISGGGLRWNKLTNSAGSVVSADMTGPSYSSVARVEMMVVNASSVVAMIKGSATPDMDIFEYSLSGTTLTETDTEEITSTNDLLSLDSTGDGNFIFGYETGSNTILSNGFTATGTGGSYVIGSALDREEDGSILWLTLWKGDDNLYLQRWITSIMTLDSEVPLGAATLSDVQSKTVIAYPFAGTTDTVYVYGRMISPAWIGSGTVHAIQSSNGGASGTWSLIGGPYGNFDDADVLDSLHVTPDLSGVGDRIFTGVRRNTGEPELWRGLNSLAFVSDIPLPTGTGVNWRGMDINRSQEVSLGSNVLGTGTNRVLSAVSPYTTWRDITGIGGPTPYPSGTVGVLRYF
jgi:hypothetical protein